MPKLQKRIKIGKQILLFSLIGEIYKDYPQYKGDIRQAHITARYLHSDGFYQGIAAPSEQDIASVERGIKAIESILKESKRCRESGVANTCFGGYFSCWLVNTTLVLPQEG